MVAICAGPCRGPIPDAGERSRQAGARSEPGADEFPESFRPGAEQGAGIHAHSGILLSRGSRADRSARPRGRAESRSRAHARPPGAASQADRRHRRAPDRGRNGNAGLSRRASSANRPNWPCIANPSPPSSAKPPPLASAWRPNRRARRSAERSARTRARLEAARQHVLRLLGEASTLRNQLAQIDEYLAAMERDAARARKEEEGASGDLARLDQVKAELSSRAFRAATGTRIAWRTAAAAWKKNRKTASSARRRRARSWNALRDRCPSRRPARIRSKKFFRIAPTPPNR